MPSNPAREDGFIHPSELFSDNESSFTIDAPLIPQTEFQDQSANDTVQSHQNVTDDENDATYDSQSQQYNWIVVMTRTQLASVYLRCGRTTFNERNVSPGTVTFLMLAKQIREAHFQKLFDIIDERRYVRVYSGTIGCPMQEWEDWILKVRDINYSDLYWFRRPPPDAFNNDPLPPEEIDPSNTEGKTYVSITRVARPYSPPLSIDSEDQPSASSPPSNDIISSLERLYIDSNSPGDRPSSSMSGYLPFSINDPAVITHCRILDSSLRKIHADTEIQLVFADLYLNLINRLCWEFRDLLTRFSSIERLFSSTDDDFLKVFKILKIFAMSSQPPFKLRSHLLQSPVLHLELFYAPLISDSARIPEPKIYLKHYLEGTELNADRYSAIAKNFFATQETFLKNSNVVTNTVH